MAILDFLKRNKQKDLSQLTNALGTVFSGVFSSLRSTTIGRKALEEYRNWVFAAVQARSENVADIQLKLCKGDGEEIEEHPLLDLLYKVNPVMTKGELFQATQAYKDLEGNAFWYLVRKDEKTPPTEVYPLRPDRVTILVDKANPLVVQGYGYTLGGSGEKATFKAHEVIHFKNFNPTGEYPFPHRGKGIVEAASWSIDSDNEARDWNYSFFKNSALPAGVITRESTTELDAASFNRLRQQWEERFKGSSNAHKIAILSGGMKWQEISRTQHDMDFIEQRRLARDEILSMFRVPKSIVGIIDDVNRASAETSEYVFMSRTIVPAMRQLMGTMNEVLVPMFGEDIYLDFVSPIKEDKLTTATYNAQAIDRWMTRNEIRAQEGLPPSKNGDKFMGLYAQVPTDEVPQEKAIRSPKVSKKYRVKSATEKVVEKVFKEAADRQIKAEEELAAQPKIISEEVIKTYIDGWKKAFEVEPEPLAKRMDLYFTQQEREVKKNLAEELKGLTVKEYSFKAVEDLIFDEKAQLEVGISLLTPFLRRYIKQSGDNATELVGSTAYDATTPESSKFVQTRAAFSFGGINDTTKDALFSTLKEGLDKGESYEQLSERVSSVYGAARDFRSDMIARTEVSAASNFGAVDAYQQAGITKHQWIVVTPEDEDCLVNQGSTVKIGDDFPSGDSEAPVHPNCQCTTIPVFS